MNYEYNSDNLFHIPSDSLAAGRGCDIVFPEIFSVFLIVGGLFQGMPILYCSCNSYLLSSNLQKGSLHE